MTQNCINCKTTGLAVTLARYSVVPALAKSTMPPGIGGERVMNVKLAPTEYAYALRAMRAGYVYVFYTQGKYGSNYWEAFTVNADGSMILQPVPSTTAAPQPKVVCSRQGHNGTRTMYFCIEKPEECGKVWIAFSEHFWSQATLDRYAASSTLRDTRMQALEPKLWLAGATSLHACEATPDHLGKVLEYMPGAASMKTLLQPASQHVSEHDGGFRRKQLEACTSIFTPHSRNLGSGQNSFVFGLTKLMQASSKRTDGKSHRPVFLALWDAVGITRELNGYRNEVAGRIEQYSQERNDKVTTLHQLDGIKNSLADAAEGERQSSKERAEDVTKSKAFGVKGFASLRLQAQGKPALQRSHMLQDIALLEHWEKNEVPKYLSAPLNNNIRTYDTASWSDPSRRPEIEKWVVENRAETKGKAESWIKGHDKKYADDVKTARSQSWAKYEARLDLVALKKFRTKYDDFIIAAEKIIDGRTVELIKWLEASLLIDTLGDYDPKSIGDGLVFNDLVGDLVFGMGHSSAGAKKLASWAADKKNLATTNLVWRAVALNQPEGIAELKEMLNYAHEHKAAILTAQTGTLLLNNLRNFAKLADLYKKAQTFADLAEKKGFTKFPKFRADKLVITVGQALYSTFRMNKGLDTIGEKVVQHILCVRGLVSTKDSLQLIDAQAKYQQIANTQMMERLGRARAFLDMNSKEMASAERYALRAAWSGLAPDKAVIAMRDVRLALVVAIFEGANFAKCAYQLSTGSKKDYRTAAYMVASGLAVTSLMFDIAATAIKNTGSATAGAALAGYGDEAKDLAKVFGEKSWSYQTLKMIGGTFSAAASTVGAVIDWQDAETALSKGQNTLHDLYRLKFYTGVGSVFTGIATTMSYAPDLSQRLMGRVIGAQAAKFVIDRIVLLSLFRLVAMGLGWAFTLGGIVLTAYIMYFKDNELQVWCNRSEFGLRHREKAFATFEEQERELEKLMGIPEDESKVK